MLRAVREFFHQQSVVEVDCPLLTRSASIDAHIDLISTASRFLHSSPEYGMKRLLSEGIGDIYQLSHVFREGEAGKKHNPEFTLIEWYRCGYTLQEMIAETLAVLHLFLLKAPVCTLSYTQAFQKICGFDPLYCKEEVLWNFLDTQNIAYYPSLKEEGRDAILNLLMAERVEPSFDPDVYTVLTGYPPSQAALSRIVDGTAQRFEIYFQGYELANGYDELIDATEQRHRFHTENAKRRALGKNPLPLDEAFLAALERGLPPACGVAVGFDRLMMLRHHVSHIKEILPFSWEEA